MRLKDKVVIVTGGAKGIGRTYCLWVAAEGARVVMADIADPKPTVKEIEGWAAQALGVECDVSREDDSSVERQFPHLLAYSDVRDVGKAAKDWPQLNFIIYHSAYRFAGGGKVEAAWAQFEQTGRIEWVTDLAEIPSKFGVSNVYGDLGQIFA
jgi:NAD(P)-dependent dehydrogenase (short-subunit alcohol dehydrogenase family)